MAHIDSSAPTVAWARRNADASQLTDRPVRWLVDDAIKFAAREVKRGNFYDGLIVDPPTYGHGPKGNVFKFEQHVDHLMELCGALVSGNGAGHRFLLFSCHAPGFGGTEAKSVVSKVAPDRDRSQLTGAPLVLESVDGRYLEAGVHARWSTVS